MLGLSWTEMLVLGIGALIFIGPKELPAVMHQIGKFAGMVRRMGNEFQREISKTAGLDEVRNLRNSITAPLKQTTDEIRREFNAIGANGSVKPSGAIKPADPKSESVVAEIQAAAGLKPTGPASSAPLMTSTPASSASEAVTQVEVTPAAKRVRATRVKTFVSPDAPVRSDELSSAAGVEKTAPARRTRTKAAAAPKPTETLAPGGAKRAPRRKTAPVTAPTPQEPEQ